MKSLHRIILIFCLFILSGFSSLAYTEILPGFFENPLEGKWDITIDANGVQQPSWLEISHSGTHTFVGRFVGVSGSARPISKININGNRFNFSIPPQWEEGKGDFLIEGELIGDRLSGTIITSENKKYNWTAKRAPLMIEKHVPVWGKPVRLFNGRDLSGWIPMGNNNQWIIENGILKSPHSGVNLVTAQTFKDFKLHIEFRYQKGSNSGVYLRGRHEVQIQDDMGKEPSSILFGGIYGFLTPNEMAAKAPGEWQYFDITLVGRKVTVVANGKKIICEQLIPGITGGALNSNEGEAGPLYLQGDHGPIEFRNIILTPAK